MNRFKYNLNDKEYETTNISDKISFGIGSNPEYNKYLDLNVSSTSRQGVTTEEGSTWIDPKPKSNDKYVSEDLLVWYDGKNNTGSGFSNITDTWKDLNNNNNDAKLINQGKYMNWNENKVLGFKTTNQSYYALIENLKIKGDYTVEVIYDYPNRNGSGYSTFLSDISSAYNTLAFSQETHLRLHYMSNDDSDFSSYGNAVAYTATYVAKGTNDE